VRRVLTRRAAGPVAAAAPSDGGFTLVELVVSIAILGVVMVGVTAVMLTALVTDRQTGTRLDESRNVQFVAAYLADDVQGATSVVTGGTARCGTGTAALELRGASFDPGSLSAQVTVVSYVLTTSTVDGVATGALHRYACAAAASPAPSYPLTPASDVVVARSLAVAPPAVTCSSAGVVGACGATTTAVSVALVPVGGGTAVSVGGTRRTTP
jgi:prepilin-type N-terminal cleavage/methylation domain-containing protein